MKILNWIKTFIFTTIFKNVIIGAALGLCIGVVIVIICDYIGYPIITFIQSNWASWFLIEHWYIGWAGAGVIAKLLPW